MSRLLSPTQNNKDLNKYHLTLYNLDLISWMNQLLSPTENNKKIITFNIIDESTIKSYSK